MNRDNQFNKYNWIDLFFNYRKRSLSEIVFTNVLVGFVTIFLFYASLIISSKPVETDDMKLIEQAIAVLDEKGFEKEVYLLRKIAIYRSSNNWLNDLTERENAYAKTNFPFGIITIEEDFFIKAQDDTERAMILLHEVQHLQGSSEKAAYGYVWQQRQKLGWTILTHGTTPTYVTIDQLTREIAPELFSCSANLYNDCTENLRAKR